MGYTRIKVCHNLTIPRHKTFDGIAERGKGTMGWFYGFKLHLITNFKGEVIDAKLTTGNVHDTKPVLELAKNFKGKLYADKGYISKKLTANLTKKATDFITTVRSNMKAKAMSLCDRAILSRRFTIETINVQLKNTSQIEHSRHRSSNDFNTITEVHSFQDFQKVINNEVNFRLGNPVITNQNYVFLIFEQFEIIPPAFTTSVIPFEQRYGY